ncbi:MAG: hypothetical protein QW331_04790 [Candidatus Woesearchaeota archaeon]
MMQAEKLLKKLLYPFLLISIEIHALIVLIFPFLKYNDLFIWDMGGHYFSSWYVKEYLFPRIIGWNPYFLLGFPQNQFYPPLYSYLTALLSFIMPLEWAFKLLLTVAILLTPLSFYYFLRSLEFSKEKASVVAFLMYAILFLFPLEHLGGNFHSTFNVGLVSNALALPLMFFYFGALKKSFATKKFVLTSLLLALIILTHIWMTIAAAIVALTMILAHFLKKKENILFVWKHFAFAFGLSAFWIIPFIAKFSYTSATSVGFDYQLNYLFLFFGGILAVAAFMKKKEASFFSALAIFLIASFMLLSFLVFEWPVHIYRFLIIMHLFLTAAIFAWFKKENLFLYLFIIVVSIGLIFTSTNLHPEGALHVEVIKELPKNMDGRVMILASYDKQPSPHIFQTKIPMMNKAHAIKGLYVESSKNSRYLFDLEIEMDRYTTLAWGVENDFFSLSNNTTIIKELLPYQFSLFNINNVISFSNYSEDWQFVKRISFSLVNDGSGKFKRYYYELYKVNDSELIQVLDYVPRHVKSENWDNLAAQWFITKDIKKGILVNEAVPDVFGTGKEKVTILEMSPTQEHIKFSVESDKDVPILIKISEFPNWKAYVNGKETKIYRASPYIMLIYGKGMIELKYENTWSDIIGNSISVVAIVILIVLTIKNGTKKPVEKIRKH